MQQTYCHGTMNVMHSGVAISVAVWTARPMLVCGSTIIKTVAYQSTTENSFIVTHNKVRSYVRLLFSSSSVEERHESRAGTEAAVQCGLGVQHNVWNSD